MELEICDILFKRGKKKSGIWNKIKWYFSYLIRYLTADGAPINKSYSHVGIYAGNGKVWDARYPQVDLYDLDYEDFDVGKIEFLTDNKKQNILKYCKSKQFTRYATDELLKQGANKLFFVPVKLDFTDEEECSTYVMDAFKSDDVIITNKPYPTPNDLSWSPIVKMYDGLLFSIKS